MALANAGYLSSSARFSASARATPPTARMDSTPTCCRSTRERRSREQRDRVVEADGTPRLPLQEDETALVLIALRNH